jgi:hypothetical protein
MPVSGARRFFSTSNASALNGETYSTRVRSAAGGGGVDTSSLIDHKNAVSVLPLPVGAQINVCSRAAMRGQPASGGGVGWGNDDANHSATAGRNESSTARDAN